MIRKLLHTATILIAILIGSNTSLAQDLGKEFSLHISQSQIDGGVQLSWTGTFNNKTSIYRKLINEKQWLLLDEAISTNSFSDTSISPGFLYEYKVEMDNSTTDSAAYNSAYGYIIVDARTDVDFERKKILVLVDSALFQGLTQEIDMLLLDYQKDGFDPYIEKVSSNDDHKQVKSVVSEYYYQYGVTYLFLIGNIAVPYSGFQAPDGHSDHLGAWPADGYYADINEDSWTEFPFFNHVNQRDPRNSNSPTDGKFDQNAFPTELEICVGRLDFSNLPVYAESELDLTKAYFNRLSDWKNDILQSNNKGIIEDSLTHENDGFGNNFYRNFSTLLGEANVESGSYINETTKQNYLVSQALSYANDTSMFSIATSQEIANSSTNSIVKMLTGSYFGDWDTPNNFLRTNLSSGNTLNSIWTGRPNYFFHSLASNSTIGECFKSSCNNGQGNTAIYDPKGSYVNSTSMALLGDPTVRLSKKDAITDPYIEVSDSMLSLSWNVKPGIEIQKFIVSKLDSVTQQYEVISEIDGSMSSYFERLFLSGSYSYIINAIYSETDFAYPFFNQTIGSIITQNVDLTPQKVIVKYPDEITLTASSILDDFYEFGVSYQAHDTGRYKVTLEKQDENENWQQVDSKNVLKENIASSFNELYFYDSLMVEKANSYRAVCSFKDSSLHSTDTTLWFLPNLDISIYPTLNQDGKVYVKGRTVSKSEISIYNNLGKLERFEFDEKNQVISILGYRKGIYFIHLDDTIHKVISTL